MIGLVVVMALASVARDPAEEAKYREAYEAVSPGLGQKFDEATTALDAQQLEQASTLLEELTRLAPDLGVAFRRLSYVRTVQERHDQAVVLAEKARVLEPGLIGDIAWLRAISARDRRDDQLVVSKQADRLLPGATPRSTEWEALKTLSCLSRARANNTAGFTDCAYEFYGEMPNSPVANLFAAQAAANTGNYKVARERLETAKPNLSPEEYERFSAALDDSELPFGRLGSRLLGATGLWLGAFLVMAVLGGLMSSLTLRAAQRLVTTREKSATPMVKALRSAYRAVIGFGALYYYLSVPFIALAVVALFGGFIYLCLVAGRIPVQLLLIALITGGGSLIALVRSLFVRSSKEDPGLKLELEKAPRLRALIDSVAAKVGTRTVDTVFITPGTDLAVFERGGLLQRLRGKGERCLIIGRGVLDGFEVGGFRSVLAHEFGHFSNEDTAGGSVALVARQSLLHMGMALAQSGVATWYNPAWWFFRAYWWTYLRISQGASRLQEVLADRVAIFTYGSTAFASGYRHVVEQSVRFDEHAQRSIRECVEAKRALPNLYRFVPVAQPVQAELDKAITEVMQRPAEPFDSHPSSSDRLGWAATLSVQLPEESAARDPVLSLFEELLEPLERKMTAEIRDNVLQAHDVLLASGD
ncbi:MAG: M48 family metalloprotease [Archangium sp.]